MENQRIASPELFKSPQRMSTVDTVIYKIKELLIKGQLRPGDKLPNEIELAKQLKTSRGSIREAMKVLTYFGILQIKRGDGTYVSSSSPRSAIDHILFQLLLSETDLYKLSELRKLIELGMIDPIIQHADDRDLEEIECSIKEQKALMEQIPRDPERITKADLRFHYALGKATKNDLIEKIYRFTLELFTPSIAKTHEYEEGAKIAFEVHSEILAGIKERDSMRAQKAILNSIDAWIRLSKSKEDTL